LNTPGSTGTPTLVPRLGERALIERIRFRLPPPPPSLVVGIGDDAAVVAPERGALQVLTTDAMVEGVHFDRRFSALADVGYKAMAVNVSDIAAMGAAPGVALVSFMLPAWVSIEDVDALVGGLSRMAAEARLGVAGGNITRSPGPLVLDVTLAGWVRPRRILTRSGGRPGDGLFVTGSVGAARAGLDWLRDRASSPADAPEDPGMAACVERYRRPEPRVRVGQLLGRTRTATACMDLSDGLADAVTQIAGASGTGARIDAASLPVPMAAAAWFASRGEDPIEAATSGGDDYELLFSVPAKRVRTLRAVDQRARGVPITLVGRLTAEPEIVLVRDGRSNPLPAGFTHF
jgi:thiamine-monophosphate kinase